MNIKNTFLVALLSGALAGCALTRSDTNVWLDSQAGVTKENVAGKWTTSGGIGANWGEAALIQDGSHFYGTLGSYYVDGAINGEHLFLVLSSGRKIYYTAKLARNQDGGYEGKVVEGAIISDAKRTDHGFSLMTLRRIRN